MFIRSSAHPTRRPAQLGLVGLLVGLWLNNAAAQTCPEPVGVTNVASIPRKSASAADISKLPIEFTFQGGEAALSGQSDMNNAAARQGDRTVSADVLHYNSLTGFLKADGNVSFEDSQLRVSGTDANMDAGGGVEFDRANFMLKNVAGRGSAERIELDPAGKLGLDNVRYTTCPAGSTDWELSLSDLDINQATHTGTGRNVKLTFMGVPIFYTPWISFPVGNERKSGFLFPNLRSSSRGGYSILLPWYWNIAPNYDATLTPIIDTKRGAQLDTEFRYLTQNSLGILNGGYLPYDPTVNSWRGLINLKHRTDFTANWRLDVNAGSVSDNRWFEDFGQGRDETAQVFLPRNLSVIGYWRSWQSMLNLQNLQTLDYKLPLAERPYSALPRFVVSGAENRLPLGLRFGFDGELAYFTRNDITDTDGNSVPSVTGARAYLAPELSWPLRRSDMYFVPSASWRYTAQQLQHTVDGQDKSPSVSTPVWSVDTGMMFERFGGEQRQRTYTLEPRLLYFYVPYRYGQRNLQVFDSGVPDFNFVQLFRVDRFVGPDRIGDANQLSAGITSRMLDSSTGKQFLSGTLGQAFYFRPTCVNTTDVLDCDAEGNRLATATDKHSSDLIGQISLTAYNNWNASAALQWNPSQQHSERSEVNFQYTPGRNRVVNLSYRFARSTAIAGEIACNPDSNVAPVTSDTLSSCEGVDQWESSFAWPVGASWSTYGRAVYSRIDNKLHDYLGGVEYRSCCWNIRLIAGRSITTRDGEYDTRYGLQLELKGLSSVGNADAFLQSSIPGYSARASSTVPGLNNPAH